MPRGGPRPNTGGFRIGAGRKRGVPNKASVARQAEVEASGETPLAYMLRIMRDETADPDRRDEMAKAAAPYVHPRLASVQHAGRVGLTLEEMLDALDGVPSTQTADGSSARLN
jgi:hypothetical protein